MTRARANMLLLLTAFLWGLAFVAQKTGTGGLGSFGFTGIRFALSALVVLPLALRESRKRTAPMSGRHKAMVVVLGAVFFTAVILQQAGMATTTITNAGFLTGLYVIFVPLFAWALFRRPPRLVIWLACAIALAGVWMLSGASLGAFSQGDWLVLGSAVMYGAQVAFVGFLVQGTGRPLTLALAQYVACAAIGIALGLMYGELTFAGIQNNLVQILYAGVISGGIAYTLQIVGQQYTSPSHAAIILLMEAPFAALAGALFLGDRLDPLGLTGCGLILAAALLAESGGIFLRKNRAM